MYTQMSSVHTMESARELCDGDLIPVYQLAMPNGSHMLKVMMPDGYPLMISISEALPDVQVLDVAYASEDLTHDVNSRTLGRSEDMGQHLCGHVIQTDQKYCFYLNDRDELKLNVLAVEELNLEPGYGRFEVYPVVDSLDLETIESERGRLTDEGLEEVIAEARAIVQLSMRSSIQDEISILGESLARCAAMVEDYQQFTEARDLATARALSKEEDYLTRCQLAHRYDQGYQFAREVIDASRGIRQLEARLSAIMERL